MARDHHVSRRTALKLTGAAATTALVAGCNSDDGNGNGNGNGDDDDDGGNGGGPYEIDPGTRVVFSGQTGGWEGKEPSEIEGESNPTLVLQEGEDYEMGWDEGDGATHNFEIRDENGDVVDDLSTDTTSDPGEDQFLEFTASSEMANYVCDPHENSMIGELQVE